jgi:hypothetical protein
VNVNEPQKQNGLKLDSRTLVIGAIVIIAALFILPRLLNTNNVNVNDPVNPPAAQNQDQPLDPNITIGNLQAATGIDRDGCATRSTSTFDANEPIYIVAPNSTIPAGTSVFARLYFNGQPLEDLSEITADQDYNNTCLNFVFEPVGAPFQSGSYEAEFIVNGNAAKSVTFTVR